MRIRVPQGVRKDQLYIVLILGTATGIYNWRTLLREHMRERERELQLNEVIKRIASITKQWFNHNLYTGYIARLFHDYVI